MRILKGYRQRVLEATVQITTCSMAHIDDSFAEEVRQGRPTGALEAHKARRHPKA